VTETDPLSREVASLRDLVEAKRGEEVVTAARALAAEVRQRFRVSLLPARTPDLEHGRQLYAEACASCHGAAGKGDGPNAALHDPRPADFTNRERALTLPLSAVYATITFGIDGTAMASFAEAYDESSRFDLTFYVGSLAFTDTEIANGETVLKKSPAAAASVVHGLGELIRRPASVLAEDDRDLAILAYLRRHPDALSDASVSFGLVRTRLLESRVAYEAGDSARAVDLAVSAYLDGFEPLEPALSALDDGLRTTIEGDFLHYRESIQQGAAGAAIADAYATLRRDLDQANDTLESGKFGPLAAFLSSLTIMAREGFECVLLIVALTGILRRAGQREALRYVHGGWIAALFAGGATWLAAQRVLEIGGFERELIEGVASLLAMAILFYVSYWLIAKVSSQRWQAFLHERITSALSRGSLWTLAVIAFVAIYREVFETILFYEAIAAQAGELGRNAVLAGAGAGLLLLAALALVTFRFGLRLPMRRFFVVSSALLYAFAIMLGGRGIAALQEVGALPATHVPFVRIEALGIYPTAESLGLQCLLLLAALFAALRAFAAQRVPEAGAVSRVP
jgi:high-affinity iron transporter